MKCDNKKCEQKKPYNIRQVIIKKQYGGGIESWCDDCREADKDKIEIGVWVLQEYYGGKFKTELGFFTTKEEAGREAINYCKRKDENGEIFNRLLIPIKIIK